MHLAPITPAHQIAVQTCLRQSAKHPRSPPRAGFLVSGYLSLSPSIQTHHVSSPVPRPKIETKGYKEMKRTEIKRRPLADTVLATLEPDTKEYREHDGIGWRCLWCRGQSKGK